MSQAIQQIVNLAMNFPYTIQTINLWGTKCEMKKLWQLQVGHTWQIKQFTKFKMVHSPSYSNIKYKVCSKRDWTF
jgi:hypothetical protein